MRVVCIAGHYRFGVFLGLSGYITNEGDGSITITVTRSGNNQGAVSIDYATSDATAHCH